jgi:ABC-type lipoprotein export system ATPase subunit
LTTTVVGAGSRGAEIHLVGVVHLYPSPQGDVVALKGVDLDVAGGESVSLLGPSGAGKSTVLGLLAGNFVASAGQVLIGGDDIGRMDQQQLSLLHAFDVSLVVQGAERNLLPYASAEENVWFAQQGSRWRGRPPGLGLGALLEQFGLGPVAAITVDRLSAGQRQRVALAAGLSPVPRLLLVDEPTSQLDPQNRDSVIDTLLQVCTNLGTTLIAVTHDPDVAARFSRTVTIRDGRVGAEGRRGIEYAVVGRDGLLQLPSDVMDLLPADSLVEVIRRPDGVLLRRADEQS